MSSAISLSGIVRRTNRPSRKQQSSSSNYPPQQKEEENKCDLSQSDRKNQMDNDSDRADNALYKEVATAVFGELNNQ